MIDGMLSDWNEVGERRDEITTLAEAAGFLRVALDEVHTVYTLVTDGDPHRTLNVDRPAATVLGEWFMFGAGVLQQVRAKAGPADTPTLSQLWPEHFDLAMEIGPEGRRANVGASPGDSRDPAHPHPYLYVGPHGAKPTGAGWNEPFGASLSYQQISAGADPVAWVCELLRDLQG